MKTVFLLIICTLFFAAPASFGREPLANENKSGLYARSIEHILRLDERDIDLATAVLIISEQWNDNVYGRRYISRLDDMALEIRKRLKEKNLKANFKAIPVINEYLFDELKFKSVEEATNPDDLFLHSVLDKKRGYCLSLSILYLSLAERLALPLYGVVVPGHFFVRYDDGQLRFNIETTGKGGTADDQHYINKFKVPQSGSNSIYMKNLNKRQTLGCFFNNLGNSYSDIGNTEQALVALERAVQINPSLAESRANLGNIYLNNEQVDDAIYEYRAALRINPNDAKTYNNLGNAYAKKEWLNDAIAEYLYSLQLDPNFIDVYTNLAAAYSKKQMFGKAVALLKKAIVLKPENSGFYNQLGNVYSRMSNYEEAVFQYKKALKIKRSLADAHYGLAICYNKLGLVNDEIRAYRDALAIEPDMVAALMNLGNVYFNRQKYDAAIEQYKKAVQVKPDNSSIYYNLGAAYSNKADYEQAADEYLMALEIDPKMADAYNGLAFVFYKLKEYESAWKHIKIAERLGAEINKDILEAIEDEL